MSRWTARPTGIRIALLAVTASIAAGASVLGSASPPTAVRRSTASAVPAATLPIIGAAPARPTPAGRAGVPVRMRIPAIDLDTRLLQVGRRPDGTLGGLRRWQRPSWYSGGPRPGDVGPAVIVGHVDSTAGPAVFFRLPELRAGDAIYVSSRTGRPLHFVVEDVDSYPKGEFPTAFVYGPQPVPMLRLVTCTGRFDVAERSYRDNLVVSARLTG